MNPVIGADSSGKDGKVLRFLMQRVHLFLLHKECRLGSGQANTLISKDLLHKKGWNNVLKQAFWGQNGQFNEVSLWHVQIGITFPDMSGILPIGATKENFSWSLHAIEDGGWMVKVNYSDSKIDLFNCDCRTIDIKVPVFISLWFGTGIVIVEFLVFFCIIIWLPRCRISSKPCRASIWQTCRPERIRNLANSDLQTGYENFTVKPFFYFRLRCVFKKQF